MSIKLDRLISDYKARSADPIRDQQTAYIPTLNDEIIECTINFYSIQGVEYSIDPSKQILIKMNYIRYATSDYTLLCNYRFGKFKMEDLIANKIIMPFVIFINGIFIPWDYISIITDGDTSYLLIEMDGTFPSFNTCMNYDYIQYLELPQHGMYSKTRPSSSNTSLYVLMSFNSAGLFTKSSPAYFISVRKELCQYSYWSRTNAVDGYIMNSTNSDVKLSESNIILFTNGLFTTGRIYPAKIACISECTSKDGAIAKHLSYTTNGKEIPENPSVVVDSSILTINGGKNPNRSTYDIILSVYNNYTDSMDIINRTDINGLSRIIKSANSGIKPEFLDMIRKPFDFALKNNKGDGQTYNSKDQNTSDVIKAIMEYDPSILTDTLLDNSNMSIDEYTISDKSTDPVVLMLKTCGVLELTLDHSFGTEYILVLVNGILPDTIYESDYNMNKFSMPIHDIKNGDIIEVLRFRNIDNRVYEDIVIKENDGFIYSSDIVNEHMKIFSTDGNHASFTYPTDRDVHHYPIGYTTETNSSGMIRIILDDPYYYGKKLSIAYDNRFAYVAGTYIKTNAIMIVDFTSKDFNFCDDYFRYFVFVNGRRLLSNHYRLVLPTRSTTPFYRFKLYLAIPLKQGDRLDIIYTPSLMKDVFIDESISATGDIVIDKSSIDYGASSDLYMFWINGKKIPKSHLANIDSTRMRIITDEKSVKSLCVTKYIPSISGLNTSFNDTSSLIDAITSKMSKDDIDRAFGLTSTSITDTESNAYENAMPIRAVMNELIRAEYAANEHVDITDKFVYGYEDIDESIVMEVSESGVKLIESMDANQENNIISDDIGRPYP